VACSKSDTLNVSGVADAAAVGVPLITPVEANVKPAGSVPAGQLPSVGGRPAVAVRACE